MKSLIRKRSVILRGHKTSISLEDGFWDGLGDIARERGIKVGALIALIDHDRSDSNLSSAVRLHVLDYYKSRSTGGRP